MSNTEEIVWISFYQDNKDLVYFVTNIDTTDWDFMPYSNFIKYLDTLNFKIKNSWSLVEEYLSKIGSITYLDNKGNYRSLMMPTRKNYSLEELMKVNDIEISDSKGYKDKENEKLEIPKLSKEDMNIGQKFIYKFFRKS